MNELINLRQENSKTFSLGENKYALEVSIGAVHYKDNYADISEQWKGIDLTWVDNKITKAPYELILEGNKITLRDKKSGEISTIELQSIGNKPIPAQAWEYSKGLARAYAPDLEIIAENAAVRFVRILKSNRAPREAKFKVTGRPPTIHARDADGELPVEVSLVDGELTETLKPDRPVRYPVYIDPTWQVRASSDDCFVMWVDGSTWALSLLSLSYWVGYWSATRCKAGGGTRFLNITIPKDSTIDTAYLRLRCGETRSVTTVNSRIRGEAADNAATFSNVTDYFARARTSFINWDNIPAWTSGIDYNSPEVKTVIQEIVNRAGWVFGNALVIFWDDHDGRSSAVDACRRLALQYDGSTTYAPKLVITYTPPPRDIQESLLTSIYQTLIGDNDLQIAMGGAIRLYPVWAIPDAEFPYLVHRIDMRILADWSPQARCTYLLDIWSNSPNASEILGIRRRIMELVDGLQFSTYETTECYLWIQTDGFVPEVEQNIFHYTMQFNLKYLKDAQIGVELKR